MRTESARFLLENVLEADSVDVRNTTLSIVRTSEVAIAVETEPYAGITWALEYGAEIRNDLELRGIVVRKGSKGGRDG